MTRTSRIALSRIILPLLFILFCLVLPTSASAHASTGIIEINIFDAQGLQLSGAFALLIGDDDLWLEEGDSVGLARFYHLPFGRYLLSICKEGYEEWLSEVDLNEARPAPIVTALVPSTRAQASQAVRMTEEDAFGDLDFSLTRADGNPAAFEVINLVNLVTFELITAGTDETGRVVFSGLPTGSYGLLASRLDPLDPDFREIFIVRDQTTTLTGTMSR